MAAPGRPTPPRPEPTLTADADGITEYTGYTAGTMTLIDQDTLRFSFGDQAVLFHPTEADPPLCH